MEGSPNSLPGHDLVVIGASAGGVETLQRVVSGLPADLPAAVCVVVHIAPSSPSVLAKILSRAGPLPCRAATDGEQLRLGEILVAPPDRHLDIEDGHVRLTVGPRENGHRPAVDPLFRTAAEAVAGRVVGVVLSGTRDDGAAGLAVIKAAGGAAIVQDPQEAIYAGMPANAIANVNVDAVVPSRLVAPTVAAMVRGERLPGSTDPREAAADSPEGEGVVTICPECGGVLSERDEAGVIQWECRVGHRYSPDSLVDAQAHGIEAGLWASIRALEDRRILLERMADRLTEKQQPRSAASFRRRASQAQKQADVVRDTVAVAAETTLRNVEESERVADAEDVR